jgi:hypothetical protein
LFLIESIGALAFWWSMIVSENRLPLFRIMLEGHRCYRLEQSPALTRGRTSKSVLAARFAPEFCRHDAQNPNLIPSSGAGGGVAAASRSSPAK